MRITASAWRPVSAASGLMPSLAACGDAPRSSMPPEFKYADYGFRVAAV
jgi:hypothetical protein